MHPASLLATIVAVLPGAAPAAAQTPPSEPAAMESEGPRSAGLSGWGILGYGNGLGIGGRYMMTAIPEGFLQNERVKDQLAIELGVDLLRYSYSSLYDDYGFVEILPVAGVLWNLWLTDQFAVYPKLDLGYAIGSVTGWEDTWGTRPTYGGFFWQTSAGLLYKTRSVAVRVELGNGLLKAGVGIGF